MYGEGIGKAIIQGLLTLLLIVAVGITISWGIVRFIESKKSVIEFRTDKPLTPELEITIKESTSDTVYIYKLP
jgi:hypothetical protein